MVIRKSTVSSPRIALGAMRIAGMTQEQADRYLSTALECGLNFFDHADIYGGGQSERIFGETVKRLGIAREKLVIQSKCGIVPGKMYDLSKEHILESVDGILERLQTDYLDLLLLHRPDALMEPEEVAEAFDILEETGKVRAFGVSNMDPGQIELLKKYVEQPIVANQMQFSLTNASMVTEGINVNIEGHDSGVVRDGGILNYCRRNDITIQAWSPLQFGMFAGTFLGHPDFLELNGEIDLQAEKYGLTPEGIAVAWILRHPADMQVIVGSTNPERIQNMAMAQKVKISREDWYRLYTAAGNKLP